MTRFVAELMMGVDTLSEKTGMSFMDGFDVNAEALNALLSSDIFMSHASKVVFGIEDEQERSFLTVCVKDFVYKIFTDGYFGAVTHLRTMQTAFNGELSVKACEGNEISPKFRYSLNNLTVRLNEIN